MTSRAANTVALLVVPPGTHRPEPLAVALRELHPDWAILPVWAGDPHLRPVLEAPLGRWFDAADEVSTTRQRELVACAPEHAFWLRWIRSARRSLAEGAETIIVLRVGAVAVLGALDGLLAPLAGGAAAAVVPRASGPLDDGCRPDERDLVSEGSWSTSVIALSSQADALLEWMSRRLMADDLDASAGRVLDRAVVAFELATCADPAVGVGPARWDSEAAVLLDLPHYDVDEPWVLDARREDRGRMRVADVDRRRALLDLARPQLAGRVERIDIPGGMPIDDVVRSVVRAAERGDDPAAPGRSSVVPAPFTDTAAFRIWLESRYWSALHAGRRDLAAAFPQPRGADARSFRDWSRRAFVDDRIAPTVGVPDLPDDHWTVVPPLGEGLNVVGYLTRESSLGDVARRLCDGLVAAGVPLARLAHQRTASPEIAGVPPTDHEIRHRQSLVVVNADQFPGLAMDHPELFTAGTHLIGYWFWELEHVPRPMREAARMVDEIWVGSQFVADAFRAAVDTPVRHVPIPIGEPVASARTRASFERLAELADRFVFAVVFDHFSVTERKNPVGVIEAFRRAFAPGEGPVLVVKSMNADRRWPQHQHVVWAAGDRPDIVIWDEHLDRADHMAFIRSVDALVSLHRSEGLGLHLAEAMWLGTPVIASRYSGNLDFMDDECSLLIDVELVPVARGEGVYPPEARWADPDLDQAAAAMRRLVEDAALAERLSTVARRRMEQQPSLADTGRTIAALLGLPALPLAGGGGMAS